MILKFENAPDIIEPDENAIAEGLASLSEKNMFAILSRSDYDFIQANGYPEVGFNLEYRESKDGGLQQCVKQPITLEDVFTSFSQYARGEDNYKDDLPWQPYKEPAQAQKWTTVVFIVLFVIIILWMITS